MRKTKLIFISDDIQKALNIANINFDEVDKLFYEDNKDKASIIKRLGKANFDRLLDINLCCLYKSGLHYGNVETILFTSFDSKTTIDLENKVENIKNNESDCVDVKYNLTRDIAVIDGARNENSNLYRVHYRNDTIIVKLSELVASDIMLGNNNLLIELYSHLLKKTEEQQFDYKPILRGFLKLMQ